VPRPDGLSGQAVWCPLVQQPQPGRPAPTALARAPCPPPPAKESPWPSASNTPAAVPVASS